MARSILRVKDVMTRDVHTVGRNDQLSIADTLMKQARIRHLPVLDEDGIVCAVVTQRDLFRGALLRALGYGARAEEAMLRQLAVKEAMSAELHTTTPDTPVPDAARMMIERKIGGLPVVEGEKLAGTVTQTGLVRLVAVSKGPATRAQYRVMQVVSPGPVHALLFDLGGVVIEIDFDRVLARWALHAGTDFAALKSRFSFDPSYQRHERGEIDV